jgi:HEAT repeat protein
MRHLARLLQSENQPLGLRARAAVHLALSRDAGAETIFRQDLISSQAELRQLSVLCLGLLRETRAVNEIIPLLDDPAINTRRAACLSLVAIGQRSGLNAVAEALLHGDEELRRAAAEALAGNEEEGHPTLQEGAEMEDLLVRRAVIDGLLRTRQPWAIEILRKMQIVDAQWVVKNAASQALEEMEQPNPRLPRPLVPLSESPWLIAFAGERGIGISPGKAALNLVLAALKEGKEEQRLAALAVLGRAGETTAMLNVYQVYYASQGEIREAALDTLWHFAATGAELPPPAQFGLGGLGV